MMLRHYTLMAIRGFGRHRLYSFINVIGLSVALACAILILLFVRDQLSYDDWIPDTQNLYRMDVTWHLPGGQLLPAAMSPFPVLNAMKAQIPGVAAVTHAVPEQMTVTAGDLQFPQTVTLVDPNFLRIIRLPLLEGDPGRVLAEPESIVLSESMAHRYFGNSDPVGRFLQVSGAPYECDPRERACFSVMHTLRVSGVLQDLPHNTSLVADFLIPNTSQADEISAQEKQSGWTSTYGNFSFIRLMPGVDPATVLRALKPILDRSVNTGSKSLTGSGLEHYMLIPFRDVHLTSGKLGEMRPAGSRTTVYGFIVIAGLIVLVACCNFMNLATARATLRAREIGLRKVVGAGRTELAVQFLVEAVFATLVSLAVALSLVEILLPLYARFLGESLGAHYLSDWSLLGAIIGGAILVGLLSGAYPAVVLSRFRPASTLKTSGSAPSGSGVLRSTLVVGQFVVSIGLGIAAIVIFRQIEFARTLDLGFNRNGIVVIKSITNLSPSARQQVARVLSTGPGVMGTALSNAVPFDTGWANNEIVHADGQTQNVSIHLVKTSPEFPSVYGMRLLAGRLLSRDRGQDLSADWSKGKNVLINAQAARRFGFSPEEALGKTIDLGTMRLTVVGVLNDALKEGLRNPVWPAVFLIDPADYYYLTVKVRDDRLPEAVSFIDRTWRSIAPSVAMQRYFMSDAFRSLLTSDQRQGTMFVAFVTIAVLIACLGLFGLVVFTAERRTKEVGIRKISGAHTADIVRLMLWRISAPVLAANLLAWPLAYLYLHRWLEGYTERIALSPLYFLAAGAGALLIAWATVYANTLRLARASPVRALRYE
ncbi:MAG TPA: ABC transporter permease [Steroidobacteraceae bacterium]|nr:ABC transporter permease [Steroidobacteraceae bacterium]